MPCDPNLVPIFHVGDQWLSFNPEPRVEQPPVVLAPDVSPAGRYEVMSSISTAGLYTQGEMQDFMRLLTHPVSRSAVTNQITRVVAGEPGGSLPYGLMQGISAEHAAALVKKGLSRLSGWITTFGTASAAAIGLFMILKVIRYILTSVLNILALREATGCSALLLAGLWSAATTFTLHRHHRRARRDDAEAGLLKPSAPPVPHAPGGATHTAAILYPKASANDFV